MQTGRGSCRTSKRSQCDGLFVCVVGGGWRGNAVLREECCVVYPVVRARVGIGDSCNTSRSSHAVLQAGMGLGLAGGGERGAGSGDVPEDGVERRRDVQLMWTKSCWHFRRGRIKAIHFAALLLLCWPQGGDECAAGLVGHSSLINPLCGASLC